MLLKEKNFGMSYVAVFSLIIALLFWLAVAAFGQTEAVQNQAPLQEDKKQTVLEPVVDDLRGITIGMTADEVKNKLGKPKAEDATGFYYVLSKEESMQITLDTDKKVNMIAMFYLGDETAAPKYEDVFGADVAVQKQANGGIYNLVRYPEAGYWVAYSKILVEDEPMITVTMQKMLQTENSK